MIVQVIQKTTYSSRTATNKEKTISIIDEKTKQKVTRVSLDTYYHKHYLLVHACMIAILEYKVVLGLYLFPL